MTVPELLTYVFCAIAVLVSVWTIGFNMGSRR